ncbi:MAG: PQQ-binding-like beta-propeller repeat protein, partial [Planctomycetia bacterium]
VERTVFDEAAGRLGPHGGRGGFAVAPDGRTLAAGRPGGVLLGAAVPETDDRWSFFDDLPHVRKTFEVWAPRFPTAMAFAADSSRLFFTMDTRPPGYENMRQPLERNEGGASFLVDAASGAVVWELRGEPADHACGAGFAAVSAGGRRTAMFDVTNRMAVVDAGGRIVAREIAAPRGASTGPETAPTDGVGAWINPSGSLALFATRSMVTLCDGTGFRRVGLAGAVSAAVIDAGPLAVVGLDDGRVVALRPDGTEAWRIATGGVGPRVAAAADTLLVGTSDGVLVAVDAGGRELRRTDVAAAADRERHEPGAAADVRALPEPVFSREPDTLAVARRRLGAREIAAWRPGGAGRPAHGREFHAVGEPIELAAPPDREAVVHLVYRRPADAAPPAVILRAGADKTEFILDLPTPAWRAVDLPVAAGGVVRVEPRGGLEVAECSMHAIAWPGPNVLFVRPPDAAATVAGDAAAEDLDIELEEDQGAAGAMKETRIWSPNPDIEQRKGPWLPAGSGYDAVNGRRWDMPNWHAGDPFTGQWVTQRNREAVQVSLAATYDVARRQSEVTRRLAVFRNEPSGLRATGGDVLGAAIDNDQFWRLFEFAPVKATVLGCHVHGDGRSQGVGELEFYR